MKFDKIIDDIADSYNQHNNIYKWTDEQLLTWSKQNNHYQDFDRNKYPSTPNK